MWVRPQLDAMFGDETDKQAVVRFRGAPQHTHAWRGWGGGKWVRGARQQMSDRGDEAGASEGPGWGTERETRHRLEVAVQSTGCFEVSDDGHGRFFGTVVDTRKFLPGDGGVGSWA